MLTIMSMPTLQYHHRNPSIGLYLLSMIAGATLLLLSGCQKGDNEPIKVGILHSLTGTMAISEKPVVDATLLAIEEINANGGLLGREVVPIVVDGKSDWPTFAREAERLIVKEKVSAIFGCWTSASRKWVKPVVERHKNILFYPVQYEGAENSANIIYGGQSANQQIVPAVNWALKNLGKRVFLIGSDYIFPHIANEIINYQLTALNIKALGESYLQLGSTDVLPIIDKIKTSQPDLIINTINGDSNIAFYSALRKAGISSDQTHVLSFSIGEPELQQLGTLAAGDYAAWSYFQSLDNKLNREFIKRFRARFGSQRVTSDPMISAYINVQLWAATVKETDSFRAEAVLSDIKHQHRDTAIGIVYVDQENNHQWKQSRIGKARADGQFDIVWQSEHPVEAVPFPLYRTPAEWKNTVIEHYEAWGGNWDNPGPQKLQAAREAAGVAAGQLVSLQHNTTLLSMAASAAAKPKSSEEIWRLENRWSELPEQDLLLQTLLNSKGAEVLRDFQQQHPRFNEIFVTDNQGGILTMSNKTSDYYQADEAWWQDSFAHGVGKVWQGRIEFDESSSTWGIPLYLPLKRENGKVAGIIKAVVNVGDLIADKDVTP